MFAYYRCGNLMASIQCIVCKCHGLRQYFTWDSKIKAPTLSETMMKSNYDRRTMARTWNYSLLFPFSISLTLWYNSINPSESHPFKIQIEPVHSRKLFQFGELNELITMKLLTFKILQATYYPRKMKRKQMTSVLCTWI